MNIADTLTRPKGEVCVRPVGLDGRPLANPMSIFHSVDEVQASGTRVTSDGAIVLGDNLFVDQGRQCLANLLGGRDFGQEDWVVRKISFGTYDEAPRFSDVSLSPQTSGSNEIELSSGVFKKPLQSVDWPQPYIVRFEGILGTSEGNGYLIREIGLWTGSDVLVARKTFPGINKSSDFALSFTWLIRC